ncbi:NAD(P)-dependent alcohol dehydrogenase [Alphaproteobacteria bacterium]|nr:NAD(P)-dependent alcohol dehydrogenase [Alphaproteobacteria bacterium]MDG1414311.1 NAD(P)-dependent alcohol dehydrogenase [Alphaproteobacteria bacterium]
MKAQVLYEYDPSMQKDLWVQEADLPEPKIVKSSDVIVKIGAAGVCRTDLHIIEGVWRHIQDPDNTLLPCVMGHENAGWVEEIGSDVTNFKVGDPVILHPLISGTDGTCLSCRRGHDMQAEDGAFPGLNIKEGGYAEYLKTSVRNLIKLPSVLAPKDVAPFSDAGLTAYRVVKKASRHLLPGQACVIIGAGGLGHIGIQCLKAMCAADIIVVEKSINALTHAMDLGADHGVLIDGNEHEAILSLTGGKGAEAVIDFVGEHGSTSMGLNMTAAAGHYYIVGYGEDIKIPTVDLVSSEKTIVGNLVGTWAELYELMELANRGRVKLSMSEYKLSEANKALHDLNDGNVKGRAVLVP